MLCCTGHLLCELRQCLVYGGVITGSIHTGDQVEMTRCELKEASPERQMRGLQGTRAPVQERRTTTRPSQPSAKIRNTKPTSRGGKIRNYNIKD